MDFSKLFRLFVGWSCTRLGLSKRRPKVFFIGFNKCGTKTVHHFFQANGYLSLHCVSWLAEEMKRPNLAKRMDTNVKAMRPILAGLAHYDFFSDMTHITDGEMIEGNRYFRELAREYPDAYFVFNDRPIENWVRSRMNHDGPRGSFMRQYSSATVVPLADVPAHWRTLYGEHKTAVLRHFRGNPRFMVFDIEDDDPNALTSFLAPHYKLDASRWKHRGSTQERRRKQLEAGARRTEKEIQA
jgi:hypothetical protein